MAWCEEFWFFFCFLLLCLLKIEEEEKKLLASIQEVERQCAEIDAEVKELDMKSKNFKELEERLVLKELFILLEWFISYNLTKWHCIVEGKHSRCWP